MTGALPRTTFRVNFGSELFQVPSLTEITMSRVLPASRRRRCAVEPPGRRVEVRPAGQLVDAERERVAVRVARGRAEVVEVARDDRGRGRPLMTGAPLAVVPAVLRPHGQGWRRSRAPQEKCREAGCDAGCRRSIRHIPLPADAACAGRKRRRIDDGLRQDSTPPGGRRGTGNPAIRGASRPRTGGFASPPFSGFALDQSRGSI